MQFSKLFFRGAALVFIAGCLAAIMFPQSRWVVQSHLATGSASVSVNWFGYGTLLLSALGYVCRRIEKSELR